MSCSTFLSLTDHINFKQWIINQQNNHDRQFQKLIDKVGGIDEKISNIARQISLIKLDNILIHQKSKDTDKLINRIKSETTQCNDITATILELKIKLDDAVLEIAAKNENIKKLNMDVLDLMAQNQNFERLGDYASNSINNIHSDIDIVISKNIATNHDDGTLKNIIPRLDNIIPYSETVDRLTTIIKHIIYDLDLVPVEISPDIFRQIDTKINEFFSQTLNIIVENIDNSYFTKNNVLCITHIIILPILNITENIELVNDLKIIIKTHWIQSLSVTSDKISVNVIEEPFGIEILVDNSTTDVPTSYRLVI